MVNRRLIFSLRGPNNHMRPHSLALRYDIHAPPRAGIVDSTERANCRGPYALIATHSLIDINSDTKRMTDSAD